MTCAATCARSRSRRGVNGKGGMPADFDMTQHGPRKLRVTTFCGMVFGTLSPDAPEFETWLGPEIVGRVRRVLRQPPAGDHRPLHPGAAEQLEALFRERARHLSRQPAAPVLRHLPHHPPEFRRRRAGERDRRAPRLGHARAAAGRGQQLPGTALRQGEFPPRRSRACSACTTSSTTTSSCRSCRSCPASSCSRCTTRSRCGRSCRAASMRPTSTGPISASPTTRRNCARTA